MPVLTLEQVCKHTSHETHGSEFNLQSPLSPLGLGEARPTLHDVFRHLVNTLTLPQTLPEMLQSLAQLTMQALRMDLCVIMLRDPASNLLHMCTCTPDLSEKGVIIRPVSLAPTLWENLRVFSLHGQLPTLPAHEVSALNPLENVEYTTLFPIPLCVGTECIGLLNCYSSTVRYYSDEDQLMLYTIANQTALTIKHRRSLDGEMVSQKPLIKAFVDDLLAARLESEATTLRRANYLGYNLSSPHVVALLELSDMDTFSSSVATYVEHEQKPLNTLREERFTRYGAVVEHVQTSIHQTYPGSLIDERDNMLVCLLCLNSDTDVAHLTAWLGQLVQSIQYDLHVRMFAGVGNLCHAFGDYRRGYAEAHEALELGPYLDHTATSAQFNDLGVYRYIHKFARADILRDQYQDAITAIVEYDQRKKACLLDTLENYLESGGNIARTANQLNVHRNTLLQRLERIQKLSGQDLEQVHLRLPLLVALKVYRLRIRSMATVSPAG